MTAPPITLATVLSTATHERLRDLARVFGARMPAGREAKEVVATRLAGALGDGRLPDVLSELGRDELRTACRAHGLPADDRTREGLIRQLAGAAGIDLAVGAHAHPPAPDPEGLPRPGQVLVARGRQWLVEDVLRGEPGDSPLVRLACLDDDAAGRKLELLWDLEIGARIVAPESEGLGEPTRLDPPAHFGAYLHALEWSAVSAADATRFQAPFRAGIKFMTHQLTPLMKALELPRANLFIADDVGLGKTIEAGLVLQELILRQQAGFVLIICPASICLQWQGEMMRRFGLRFEVMTRQFVAQRRVQRGFGVNPWATHDRFIISHQLVRRPEYRDPLLIRLGRRAEKGLLILDEAHVAAPASASRYAVDTETTAALRDLAPRFDNRLFLSATPHNGHTNSFSALLEILDPIRFTRGVPIAGTTALAPVMVRRLKRDLRQLGVEKYPERILCRIELTHGAGGWSATEERFHAETDTSDPPTPLARNLEGDDAELELSRLLARYTELRAPGKGRGQLVFINLQKRLLSSPEAFARTLEVHARAVERGEQSGALHPTNAANATPRARQLDLTLDAETHGEDDEALAAAEDADVHVASQTLEQASAEATAILKRLRALAESARRQPDGKTRALLAWMRAALCPAIGRPRTPGKLRADSTAWTDRRVIIFTEYGDTKRYLQDLLTAAIADTDRGDERLLVFHGGMGDEARAAVQTAFNTHPQDHPARILVATDAAREGVNLQAHCADLFHFDVPWNPSRLEQRNGRIDRTLQPAEEVRCHYFVHAQRDEDRVLETLVRKIEVVQRELGSVGAVLMDEMERTLVPGITSGTAARLTALSAHDQARTAAADLEGVDDLKELRAEIARAGQRFERSRKALSVDPASLRGVVEVGLALAGAGPLTPGPALRGEGALSTHVLPELDRSWQPTLDLLRPPREPEEAFWEWRLRPPKPVTFEPLQSLTDEAEQLHLAHPLVRRLLDRFLAQGVGAHDLSRVTAVVVPGESAPRAIAHARLTLFGLGAARLHDEIIAVVADWSGDRSAPPKPVKDAVSAARTLEATHRALATGARTPAGKVGQQALAAAPGVFAALWPRLEAEADSRGTDARNGLGRRARKESEDLRRLLERQREAIPKALQGLSQGALFEAKGQLERRQVELDIQHLDRRQKDLAQEIEREPAAIEALYQVQVTRLTPVGLVFAWPESMA